MIYANYLSRVVYAFISSQFVVFFSLLLLPNLSQSQTISKVQKTPFVIGETIQFNSEVLNIKLFSKKD